jgi:collagenase-like PrtC family protease
MNLGLTKQDAEFLECAIVYFCKSFQKSVVSINTAFPDADIKNILNQLSYIIELGDDAVENKKMLESILNK